jgi:hypothetical protein
MTAVKRGLLLYKRRNKVDFPSEISAVVPYSIQLQALIPLYLPLQKGENNGQGNNESGGVTNDGVPA